MSSYDSYKKKYKERGGNNFGLPLRNRWKRNEIWIIGKIGYLGMNDLKYKYIAN